MSTSGREAATAEQAQVPGITRIDLQRQDLSAPGREVIQNRVEISDEAPAIRHKHPGEEIIYVLEGSLEYQIDGMPAKTYSAGEADRPGRDGSRSQKRGRGQRGGACDLRHREGQALHRLGRGLSSTYRDVEEGV